MNFLTSLHRSLLRLAMLLFLFIGVQNGTATVLVSNYSGDSIAQFDLDGSNGEILVTTASGGLDLPHRSRLVPDGSLLVASAGTDNLLRYDLASGLYLGEFVSAPGVLDYPVEMIFRPDGFLYVSSQLNDMILRFDASTGVHDNTWSASNISLDGPSGMAFAGDGSFYVSGRYSDNVVQFGADGTFLRAFGTVDEAFGMVFREDGTLLVSSGASGTVELFSNLDDVLIQTTWASGLSVPVGVEALGDGTFLVAQFGNSTVTRFDSDGNSMGTFATGSPLNGPNFITVIPEPSAAGLVVLAMVAGGWCKLRRRTSLSLAGR